MSSPETTPRLYQRLLDYLREYQDPEVASEVTSEPDDSCFQPSQYDDFDPLCQDSGVNGNHDTCGGTPKYNLPPTSLFFSPGPESRIDCVTLSPDSCFAACSYGNGKIRIFYLPTSDMVAWWNHDIDNPRCGTIAWDITSTRLLANFTRTQGVIWDLTDPPQGVVPPYTLLAAHSAPIIALATSPDGRTAATAAEDGTIQLFHLQDGEQHGEIHSSITGDCGLKQIQWSPNGELIAGRTASAITVWDVDNPNRLCRLDQGPDCQSGVSSFVFSANSRIILAVYEDHTVRVWNVETGDSNVLCDFSDFSDFDFDLPEWAIGSSPTDDEFIIGHNDTVGVFRDRSALSLTAGILKVNDLTYSPDGRYIAAGCDDGCTALWECVDGTSILIAKATGERVRWVRFTQDGMKIVMWSYSNTLRIWDMAEIIEEEEESL